MKFYDDKGKEITVSCIPGMFLCQPDDEEPRDKLGEALNMPRCETCTYLKDGSCENGIYPFRGTEEFGCLRHSRFEVDK